MVDVAVLSAVQTSIDICNYLYQHYPEAMKTVDSLLVQGTIYTIMGLGGLANPHTQDFLREMKNRLENKL